MNYLVEHPDINTLAIELTKYTGETIEQAVATALRERLDRERTNQQRTESLSDRLLRIGRECAALPILDQRSTEEILAYNDIGAPAQ